MKYINKYLLTLFYVRLHNIFGRKTLNKFRINDCLLFIWTMIFIARLFSDIIFLAVYVNKYYNEIDIKMQIEKGNKLKEIILI